MTGKSRIFVGKDLIISRRLQSMKGFTEPDGGEYKEKFQQKFIPCPEWAEAESEIIQNGLIFEMIRGDL